MTLHLANLIKAERKPNILIVCDCYDFGSIIRSSLKLPGSLVPTDMDRARIYLANRYDLVITSEKISATRKNHQVVEAAQQVISNHGCLDNLKRGEDLSSWGSWDLKQWGASSWIIEMFAEARNPNGGFTLVKELRSKPGPNQNVPILFLVDKLPEWISTVTGKFDWMFKPISDWNELVARAGNLLGRE